MSNEEKIRRRRIIVALSCAAVLLGGMFIAVSETVARNSVQAEMARCVTSVLPEGDVDPSRVQDYGGPALFSLMSAHWEGFFTEGVDGEGGRIDVSVRGFDRANATAQSVSWLLRDIAYAEGLEGIESTAQAEGEVAGHHVRVQLSAYVDEGDLFVDVFRIWLDGTIVERDGLPAEMRDRLAPLRLRVPHAEAAPVVGQLWFTGSRIDVVLEASEVRLCV